MADLNSIVDSLSSLTIMEAAELAKLLETKWGVSAAAPVAVAAAAGGGAAAAAAEEKDEFTVTLISAGDKKIQVIKEVRAVTDPRPQGGQGPGGGRAQGDQGGREQGGSRQDQGAGRGRRRPGPDQVAADARLAGDRRRPASAARRFPARASPFRTGGRVEAVNANSFSENVLRVRKSFLKIPSILDIPDLIEIQKHTFERFLQARVEPEKRENSGLQAVFQSVFPIKDFNDSASLEFVGYTLEEPKYDVQECLQRGMTYAAPFKVTIRLVAWDDTEGSQAIRDVKEQEVYFGEIPIMTENGTFIINGTERVIVSQLHRSPGIFFDTSASSTVAAAGKRIYSCRIIPYRGSWLDLEFDHKDLLYARIDRRRKIHGTVLLKALGYAPRGAARLLLQARDDPHRRQEDHEERRRPSCWSGSAARAR